MKVSQQRAQRPALWCAQVSLHHHPAIHDPGVQIRPDQPDHSSILDAPAEPVDQDVVVDPVEELRQVHVHHHALARLNVRPRGLDRIVRTPPRPEPVAVVAEGGVDQRLQLLQQGLLDQPVRHRRDAQLTLGAVRLRNHHLAYRTGPVMPLQQRLADLGPPRAQHELGLLDVEPVHPSRTLVGLDPLPRQQQVVSRQRRLQQATRARLRPCRPCARVLTRRAASFVAGKITRGFTTCYACPPGFPQHLTHGPRHPRVLGHSLSFGPSSKPLLPSGLRAQATTTSADFSLRHQPSPFQAQGEISPGKNALLRCTTAGFTPPKP